MSEIDQIVDRSRPAAPLRRFEAVVENGLGDQAQVTVTVQSSRHPCPVVGTLAVRQAKQVLEDVGPWILVAQKEL